MNAMQSRHTTIFIKEDTDFDFVRVGRLTNIPTPNPETEEIDISALDTEGNTKEFLPGAVDNGSIELVGQYKPGEGGQNKLYELSKSKKNFEYMIVAPEADGIVFSAQYKGRAWVSSCKPFGDAAEGEILPFNATLRLTSEPEYIPAWVTGQKAPTPGANPDSSEFEGSLEVELFSQIGWENIHFTANGSTPTADSPIYNPGTKIPISTTTTIKAINIKEGLVNSDVATFVFTQAKVAAPVADPDGGEFETSVEVELSCATEDAVIYFTTDGTDPDETDTEYTEAIELTATTTIKAVAVKDGLVDSDIVSKTFTKAS